jgi:hypothetical protein
MTIIISGINILQNQENLTWFNLKFNINKRHESLGEALTKSLSSKRTHPGGT